MDADPKGEERILVRFVVSAPSATGLKSAAGRPAGQASCGRLVARGEGSFRSFCLAHAGDWKWPGGGAWRPVVLRTMRAREGGRSFRSFCALGHRIEIRRWKACRPSVLRTACGEG